MASFSLANILTELGPIFLQRAPQLDKENQFCGDNLNALREHGVYKALIPTTYGGHGCTYDEMADFLVGLAQSCPATSLTLSMHQHLVAVLCFKAAAGDTGAQETLKKVASNGLVLVSTGGGDWVNSNGRSEKVPGGYRIYCRKAFCSGALLGDVAVMSCAHQDEDGDHVLHFSVPLTAEGVSIDQDWQSLGMRGTGSHAIVFDGVFVPEERVALKRPGGEWHQVWNVVSTFAVPLFMAPYLGVTEAIAAKTKELVAGRQHKHASLAATFGKLHGHLRIARWAFADLKAGARNLDAQPDLASASRALEAKTLLADNSRQVAQLAMAVLGGYAYYEKAGIERLYRDLLAAEFHPLQGHTQEAALGRVLLGGDMTG